MSRQIPRTWSPAILDRLNLHPSLDGEGTHDLLGRSRDLAAILFEAADTADSSAQIQSEAWRALRRSGLSMAPWPREHGGEDLLKPQHQGALFEVLRLVGWGDPSFGRLFEGHVNAVSLVCRYGTPAQIGKAAREVSEGALMGVWGAEDAVGLLAERVPGGWRLAGRKIFASGAGCLARPIVTVSTPAGQIMMMPWLRPAERADITGWTAQGMRSTATGTMDLSGLTIADEEVLGGPGDFMRQPHFSGGAWRFCAIHLGAAQRLVDLFRDHLVSRRRDGDPYQLQRLAQCVAATATAAFWVSDAARHLAEETLDAEAVVAFVNLTRMVTERAALDVLEAVHRGVGLQAFLRPNPIERISRDLSTYLRQPVPDLAMADAARTIMVGAGPIAEMWGPPRES